MRASKHPFPRRLHCRAGARAPQEACRYWDDGIQIRLVVEENKPQASCIKPVVRKLRGNFPGLSLECRPPPPRDRARATELGDIGDRCLRRRQSNDAPLPVAERLHPPQLAAATMRRRGRRPSYCGGGGSGHYRPKKNKDDERCTFHVHPPGRRDAPDRTLFRSSCQTTSAAGAYRRSSGTGRTTCAWMICASRTLSSQYEETQNDAFDRARVCCATRPTRR